MKTELPSIEPYGNYSSSNYGVHSLRGGDKKARVSGEEFERLYAEAVNGKQSG